ncbi:MAG: HDOD domain-containing protein [Desulfuromonadales bacterium]|nr:HDOD domain-containing protein [Desulfuromonadales bacterium]MBN2792368.1 HDOD domain-containing protein [Desulfuromonadales bacterium]
MLEQDNQVKTLLASQPIYNVQKDLYGFELLFRHELFASAEAYGEDLATSEVVLNLCTGINQQIDQFSRPIFINLNKGLLLSDAFLPLPPGRVVIELPASIQIDDALVSAIQKWRNEGFSFALDGFDFHPRYQAILNDISYLKVDVLSESIDSLAAKMSRVENKSAIWIAERVETELQYNQFKDLGFSLFQGYFLARPSVIQGQTVRGKINTTITTVNAVSHPEIEVDKMAEVVSRDPNLATQLLKIVNSPVCGLLRPMGSIKDAIVYMGLIQVRKWIIMMSLLNETTTCNGAIHLVLTRAKACENYAEVALGVKSDQAFLVGLLSGVNLLFGIDNELFLQQLSLQPDIDRAILEEEGILGQILSEVKKAEYSIQQKLTTGFDQESPVFVSYHKASTWAESVLATA